MPCYRQGGGLGSERCQLGAAVVQLSLAAQSLGAIAITHSLDSPVFPIRNEAFEICDCSLLNACELTFVLAHFLTLY